MTPAQRAVAALPVVVTAAGVINGKPVVRQFRYAASGNRALAQRRAEAHAHVLKKQGFSVTVSP